MALEETVLKILDDEIAARSAEINGWRYIFLPLWVLVVMLGYCGAVAVAFSWSGWNPTTAAKAVVPVLLSIAPMAVAATLYLFRHLDKQIKLRHLHGARDTARKLFWLNTQDPKVLQWRYELLDSLFGSHDLKLPALSVPTPKPKLTVLRGDKQ